MRTVAFGIIAVIPLVLGAWALYFIAPIALETYQAAGEVFVPRATRTTFVDASTVTPEKPDEVAGAPGQTDTPNAADSNSASTPSPTTAASPTATIPGVPSPTATQPAPTTTPYPEWDGDDPVNILLLGVDTRPGDELPPRSDTIIVVRVDPEAKRVDMFSVPRDLMVTVPGYGEGVKVNTAYPVGVNQDAEGGGPTLVAQTIEYNFGIPIHYYATVDIPGLEQIIDILGGIVVDVQATLKDEQFPTDDYRYTRIFFPTGLQRLNGVEAVQYARTRHPDNDFERSERQHEVLFAIREQALQTGILSKLPDLISEIGDSVRTDLSPQQVLSLARLGQNIPRDNIYSHSITQYMQPTTIGSGYYLVGDWPSLRWVAQNLPENTSASNNPDE